MGSFIHLGWLVERYCVLINKCLNADSEFAIKVDFKNVVAISPHESSSRLRAKVTSQSKDYG